MAKRGKKGISQELYDMVVKRGEALLELDLDKVRDIDKAIQKQKNMKNKNTSSTSPEQNWMSETGGWGSAS